MLQLVSRLFGKRSATRCTTGKSLIRRRRSTPRLEALEDRCVPAVLFVDPNNITIKGAFSTIGAAVSAAHPGDTIKVVAGTYNEEQININKAGLTIIGGQVRIPIEERPGPSTLAVTNPTAIGFILDANNITIEGFTIVQGSIAIAANAGFSGYHILGNTFHDDGVAVNLNTALLAAGTTTISGNLFTSGDSGLTGIAQSTDVFIGGAGASNVVISNNHFVSGAANGSIVVDATSQSTNIQVLNNSFSADTGIAIANAAKVKVDGNLIVNPLTTAIALKGGVTNSEVARNHILATASTTADGIDVNAVLFNGVNTQDNLLNNAIHGMGVGISVSPANHTAISGNTVAFSASNGIVVNDAAGSIGNDLIGIGPPPNPNANVVSANTVHSSGGVGISVTSDAGDTVAHNVVDENRQGGIALVTTTNTLVTANTVTSNFGDGISLTGSFDTVSGNTANANSGNGITLGSAKTSVLGNSASFNVTGILVTSNGNLISRNVAQDNTNIGFELGGSVQANSLVGNTASGSIVGFDGGGSGNGYNGNVAVGNVTGFNFSFSAANSTVTNNTASSNAQEGFKLDGGGTNNLFKANVADDNGTDGFLIENVGGDREPNTITGNTADRNGQDGIDLFGTIGCTVTGNTVLNNLGDGIDLNQGSDNSPVFGTGNTISGNTAFFNGLGGGGFDLFDATGTTTANTWSNNKAGTRNPGGLG